MDGFECFCRNIFAMHTDRTAVAHIQAYCMRYAHFEAAKRRARLGINEIWNAAAGEIVRLGRSNDGSKRM